jgi:hypothetical protein
LKANENPLNSLEISDRSSDY